MANNAALGIFISCFLVVFLCSLFIPCAFMAFNEPENKSNCINQNQVTSFFKSLGENFVGTFGTTFAGFIEAVTGIFGIISTLILCMFWSFGLSPGINLILEPIRIIGLISLYMAIAPTK